MAHAQEGPRLAESPELLRILLYRQDSLARLVSEQTGGRVASGIFAGMELRREKTQDMPASKVPIISGSRVAKLLGVYEQELHPLLRDLCSREYRGVINVGCAEGYYAVGLGLRLPKATVIAIDTSEQALRACRELALMNGVETRIELATELERDALRRLLARGRVLLMVDCEGCEDRLLDAAVLPELTSCDIVVECHDFVRRDLTDRLIERFRGTHRIQRIDEGLRDIRCIPTMSAWPSVDQMIALCEFRPERMHWLFLEAMAVHSRRESQPQGGAEGWLGEA